MFWYSVGYRKTNDWLATGTLVLTLIYKLLRHCSGRGLTIFAMRSARKLKVRRYVIGAPPIALTSPTTPRWLLGAAPKPRCSMGASGSSVPVATAGRSIWCCRNVSATQMGGVQSQPVTDPQHLGSTTAHFSGRPARRRPVTTSSTISGAA